MFRFAHGLAQSGQDRIGAVLSACAATESVPSEVPIGPHIDVRHAALGMLSEALSAAAKAPARARRQWSRVAAATRRRAGRLHSVSKRVRRLPGVPRAGGRLRAWHDSGRRQLARWTELGRREQAASQILARDALNVLRENVIARVSDSSDVKRVIREQSEGVAVHAVAELRDSSARADNFAQQAVGRFLGRGRGQRT